MGHKPICSNDNDLPHCPRVLAVGTVLMAVVALVVVVQVRRRMSKEVSSVQDDVEGKQEKV